MIKQNQGVITDAKQLAELRQSPVNEAEAMMEAQRMVEKHQKAFDLLR